MNPFNVYDTDNPFVKTASAIGFYTANRWARHPKDARERIKKDLLSQHIPINYFIAGQFDKDFDQLQNVWDSTGGRSGYNSWYSQNKMQGWKNPWGI